MAVALEEAAAMTTNPSTPADWQDAVDAAKACLAIDAARTYGLIVGGPVVDVDRCVEILALGEALGVHPRHDAVERFMAELEQPA